MIYCTIFLLVPFVLVTQFHLTRGESNPAELLAGKRPGSKDSMLETCQSLQDAAQLIRLEGYTAIDKAELIRDQAYRVKDEAYEIKDEAYEIKESILEARTQHETTLIETLGLIHKQALATNLYIDEIRNTLSSVLSRIDILEEHVQGTQDEISKVKQGMEGLGGDISEVKQEMEGLGGDISEVMLGQEGLSNEISEVKQGMEGLGGDVNEVKQGMEGLGGDISEVKLGQEGLSNEISKVKQGMEGLGGDISEVKQGMEGLGGDISEVMQGQEGLSNEISKVKQGMEGLDGEIDNIKQGLDELGQSVDAGISGLSEAVSDKLTKLEKLQTQKLIPAARVAQSTTYNNNTGPEEAVDGNYNTASHTTCDQPRQWFRYYFSDKRSVGLIKVVNGKLNLNRVRLNGARVSVMVNESVRRSCRDDTITVRDGETVQSQTYYLDCSGNSGIGVEFVLDTGTCLEFRQIEVFAS